MDTRVGGAVNFAAGTVMAVAGYTLAVAGAPTVAGTVAGVAVGTYGIDVAGHGLADVFTGRRHPTFTGSIFDRLTDSPPGTGDDAIGTAMAAGGAYKLATSAPAAWKAAKGNWTAANEWWKRRCGTPRPTEARPTRPAAPGVPAIPRAQVVGVPESSDVVTLWKAPGRTNTGAAGEVRAGFDPAKYPGNGPYFATDDTIAHDFLRSYNNGLQEINIPRSKFDELVHRGVIQADPLYEAGRAWHVPADKLAEFNEAIKQGATNKFHP